MDAEAPPGQVRIAHASTCRYGLCAPPFIPDTMQFTPSMPTLPAYLPEPIWLARRRFFDEGQDPTGLVSEPVLRGWKRCLQWGRSVHDTVDFMLAERMALGQLMAQHATLMQAARPEVDALAAAVIPAGHAVLLTEAGGRVLFAEGAGQAHNEAFRLAFRPGVDVSEESIGSSAMSVALREGQATRLFGPEHFFAATQIFHCCAAPVFDPAGQVIATVDISHDRPALRDSALWMAQRCADRIERRLFLARPASLHMELDLALEAGGAWPASQALLAWGEDGELVAASRHARQLLGLQSGVEGLRFEQLFDISWSTWLDAGGQRQSEDSTLRLLGGVRLRARVLNGPDRMRRSMPVRGAAGTVLGGLPSARSTARFASHVTLSGLVLGDPQLEADVAVAQRAYLADLPVLLTGETGCGKEVVAQALHAHGPRQGKPFVALNCAGIPPDLLAGELFGHTDGAYTGSRRGGASGKVEAADGGTLFLDEIGDLPLHVQATLLRVLDRREVMRLGATQTRTVDVRILSATHQDLLHLVREGRFREDLYYRLAGHVTHLTPLRQRRQIGRLLDVLMADLGCEPARLDADARRWLGTQAWPGNVRQLRHVLRKAVMMAEPDQPLSQSDMVRALGTDPALGGSRIDLVSPDATVLRGLPQMASDAIDAALRQTQGNVTEAARLLGIGRATLYRRLAKRGAGFQRG